MAVSQSSVDIEAINRKTAIRFMGDVRQSLLEKYDWGDLLSAAPTSLSLIGSCYIAASSTDIAINMKDVAPAGGFEYLRYEYFKPCLMQVADAGTDAFLVAERNMGAIADSCSPINQLVNDIVESIEYLPESAGELTNSLQFLKTCSDKCLKDAEEVHEHFDRWRKMVEEMSQVTSSKVEHTKNEAQENTQSINVNRIVLKGQEEAEATAKEEAKLMKQQMLDMDEQFKEAAENCPGVYEGLAIGVVESLSKAGVTAFSQVMTRMTNSSSLSSPNNPQPEGPIKDNSHRIKQERPYEKADPAYAAAELVGTYIDTLYGFLTGGEGGTVNWAGLNPNDGNTGIDFIEGSLKSEHVRIGSPADATPSAVLKQCLSEGMEIIAHLRESIKESKNMASVGTPVETVQKWQKRALEVKVGVTALKVTAASLPGNTTTTSSNLEAQPNNSSDITGKSALATAAERKSIALKTYQESQQTYRESSKQLQNVQVSLAKIRGELAKLDQQNATLEQVKEILNECLNILISLKGEIAKLVKFFGAISAMVDNVNSIYVARFLEQAEHAKVVILAGTSLVEYQKKQIYTSCLMVRCYFMLMKEVATVYRDVSIKYISKGVEMCNGLSKAIMGNEAKRGSDMYSRKKSLNDYTDLIDMEIRRLVKEKQEKITAQLESRVVDITKETHTIQAMDSQQKKALESALAQGTKVTMQYKLKEEKTTTLSAYVARSSFKPLGGFGDDD